MDGETQYGEHPSSELKKLFAEQEIPHQGQDPRLAQIIIFGLDANYSPEISNNKDFFKRIIEYQKDGVKFWHEYGVHHPFLLSDYPYHGGKHGRRYHKMFSKMGLSAECAEYISFVELLDVPTIGNTTKEKKNDEKFWELFNPDHARRLNQLIEKGDYRMVLLSSELMKCMKKVKKDYDIFSWLPSHFSPDEMEKVEETIIYGVPHLSYASNSDLKKLSKVIQDFCK